MSRVTTFYSYKGGSGRSMAMANVAWALATNGERVLAIDWDLEAPGLHRYFHPFLEDPEQAERTGLIDRIWEYIDGASSHSDSAPDRYALADCSALVQPLDLPGRSKGCLHFIGAGRQDKDYSDKVGGLDWTAFYARFAGRSFIERVMYWARQNYTHILIDSRTGVADTAGICTVQIPDAVVMCMVYNRQSIEGTAAIAESILQGRRAQDLPQLRLRLVPSRVEERGEVDGARRHAALRLAGVLDQERQEVEHTLRRQEVRHFAWCAFEEKLAVFEDTPDERGSLLDAMHELARHVGERRLQKVNFPREFLAEIWRRASFDDPRIAELRLLDAAPVSEALPQIHQWIHEALEEPDQRLDWLIALAEAAINHAGSMDGRTFAHGVNDLGAQALQIAFKAASDDERYRTRFALLLHTRAGHMQAAGDFREALALSDAAIRFLGEPEDAVGRWRLARAYERRAEIHGVIGDLGASLADARKAVELYMAIPPRSRPAGSRLDTGRAQRILAEKLLASNDLAEAERVSEMAIRQLQRSGYRWSGRDASEVVNIFIVRAEAAARLRDGRGRGEVARVRGLAAQVLPDNALMALDERLRLTEARLVADQGDVATALALLDQASNDPSARAAALVVQTELLLQMGLVEEAADRLGRGLSEGDVPLTPALVDAVQDAYQAAGREGDISDLFVSRLIRADRDEIMLIRPRLRIPGSSNAGGVSHRSEHSTEPLLRRLAGKRLPVPGDDA